jgi:hypothetical protein
MTVSTGTETKKLLRFGFGVKVSAKEATLF